MKELWELIRALAIVSWRYNTFRGRWSDMPSSTGLCIALGLMSFVLCVLVTIGYGLEFALVVPAVWMSMVWMFASDECGFGLNMRLMSAVFLTTIPSMLILAMIGKGHFIIEVLVGIYLSAAIISLKERA